MDEKKKGAKQPARGSSGKAAKRVPYSRALKARKEELYDQVPLNVRQLNWIIRLAGVALAIVIALIALESAGIFRIGG